MAQKWRPDLRTFCEPISLSLERALSSETGSQDPCLAHHAVVAWEHFVLLCDKDDNDDDDKDFMIKMIKLLLMNLSWFHPLGKDFEQKSDPRPLCPWNSYSLYGDDDDDGGGVDDGVDDSDDDYVNDGGEWMMCQGWTVFCLDNFFIHSI